MCTDSFFKEVYAKRRFEGVLFDTRTISLNSFVVLSQEPASLRRSANGRSRLEITAEATAAQRSAEVEAAPQREAD